MAQSEIVQCEHCRRPIHKSEAKVFEELVGEGQGKVHYTCGDYCFVKVIYFIGQQTYEEMNAIEACK